MAGIETEQEENRSPIVSTESCPHCRSQINKGAIVCPQCRYAIGGIADQIQLFFRTQVVYYLLIGLISGLIGFYFNELKMEKEATFNPQLALSTNEAQLAYATAVEQVGKQANLLRFCVSNNGKHKLNNVRIYLRFSQTFLAHSFFPKNIYRDNTRLIKKLNRPFGGNKDVSIIIPTLLPGGTFNARFIFSRNVTVEEESVISDRAKAVKTSFVKK